jgi:UDP-glucuronate 4-epimerase
MTNKNILITGGAGFIGSNLIDLLLFKGHHIVCLDNFDPFYDKKVKLENLAAAKENENFVLIEGDIRNQIDLELCLRMHPIELVIHLAARAGVHSSVKDPKSCYDVNVTGTLNVLEAMRKYGVNKLLFASSSSVYGNNTKVPFSELDNVDCPISPYAATKKAGELLCHTYHHLYGFDIFCLRFFTVYGPHQRPDLAIHKFTNLAFQNKSIPVFGDGSSSRDYTYIEDILEGIVLAMSHLSGYEIINLGESKPVSLNELIKVLEDALCKKIKVDIYPKQAGDVEITYADISKAQQLLNYRPHWSFQEGIRAFVQWKMGLLKDID